MTGQGHPDDPQEGLHLQGDLIIRAGLAVQMKTGNLTHHHQIEVRAQNCLISARQKYYC